MPALPAVAFAADGLPGSGLKHPARAGQARRESVNRSRSSQVNGGDGTAVRAEPRGLLHPARSLPHDISLQ